MDATFASQRLMRHLGPVLAGLIGFGIALGIATAPATTLDAVVDRLDLGALFPMAAPPVGVTGRSLLAIAVGGAVAALGWIGHLRRERPFFSPRVAVGNGVAVRRADAHPDAPPRPPLRARDMMVQAPAPPAVPVPAPAPAMAETVVAPSPPPPAAVVPPVAILQPRAVPPTTRHDDIAAMLDRLERAARRPAPPPEPVPASASPAVPRLEDTLAQLRRLATG